MTTITNHYREMNRQLHEKDKSYGAGGHSWAPHVENLAMLLNSTSILDFGCGKGTLAAALPELPIREYDPAIPGKDSPPAPADIVVCCDVLEHVEPACMSYVLDELDRVTDTLLMAAIHIGPAVKSLADGRNAHLSQNEPRWWIEQFNARWHIVQLNRVNNTLFMLVRKTPAPEIAANPAEELA